MNKKTSNRNKVVYWVLSILFLSGLIGGTSYLIYQRMPVPIVTAYLTAFIECDFEQAKKYIHPECDTPNCKRLRSSSSKVVEQCLKNKEETNTTITSVTERNRTVDELFYVEVETETTYIGKDSHVSSNQSTSKKNRTFIIELKKADGGWKIVNF